MSKPPPGRDSAGEDSGGGRHFRILVVGNATIDENSVGDFFAGPSLGGTGSILSLALARFGNQVTWMTHLGEDAGGFLEPIRQAGIKVLSLPCAGTLRFENRYPDPGNLEHRTQRAFCIPPPFPAEAVGRVLESEAFDSLALGPLTPGEISPESLSVLRGRGMPVALDAQGYLRVVQEDGTVLDTPWPSGNGFPAGVDIVHVNDSEAYLLARGLGIEASRGDVGALACRLARRLQASILSVTLGAHGSFLVKGGVTAQEARWTAAYCAGQPAAGPPDPGPREPGGASGQEKSQPAGDSTGCGDIFLAALIHGEMSCWPQQRSSRFASVAAGINASKSVLHVPTAGEVEGGLRLWTAAVPSNKRTGA